MSIHIRSELQPETGDALLVVDVQNDFLRGGSLEVPRGDEVVPVLNRYLHLFEMLNLPVYASRDWHPSMHCSFRAQGGIWPAHCLAGTQGAEFSPELRIPVSAVIISKGCTQEKDAYSAFQDTDLDSRLRKACIRRLYVGGLATDYCVLNTVCDARRLGYDVFLLTDAIRAVNPGDAILAQHEMLKLGATPVNFETIAA